MTHPKSHGLPAHQSHTPVPSTWMGGRVWRRRTRALGVTAGLPWAQLHLLRGAHGAQAPCGGHPGNQAGGSARKHPVASRSREMGLFLSDLFSLGTLGLGGQPGARCWLSASTGVPEQRPPISPGLINLPWNGKAVSPPQTLCPRRQSWSRRSMASLRDS